MFLNLLTSVTFVNDSLVVSRFFVFVVNLEIYLVFPTTFFNRLIFKHKDQKYAIEISEILKT
jgi:hypothetical protein